MTFGLNIDKQYPLIQKFTKIVIVCGEDHSKNTQERVIVDKQAIRKDAIFYNPD
jgi:hypothetical protein